MIDIALLREQPDMVRENARNKGYDIDVERVIELDTRRRELRTKADKLREERNTTASQAKGIRPEPQLIEQGKKLKEELATLEADLSLTEEKFFTLFTQIPNLTSDDVPLGDEKDSVEIKKIGDCKSGGKDHVDFATTRDWVDFERGAKVAGAKFYYLKGDLALLENALFQYTLDFIISKGFTFITVPHMVNARIAEGAGFAPKGDVSTNEYFVEETDLTLIGTAEAPLTGYHADEIIDEDALPLCYVGYSPCYRKEAGTYGKHTRGLFRVHQFNKVEMYIFCTPEKSQQMHEKILEIEEELWQSLGISYRVVNIAAGDLGSPAAKKYDIEYWSPVDETYRELTSCSNCTDYQARNLNIRVRRNNGKLQTLHTLNGTAAALARSLVAVIENYQNEDGTLRIPEKLRPYMSGREMI
jgi:seryl-tRNA synthetase